MMDYISIDGLFDILIAANNNRHDLFMQDAQALYFDTYCFGLALSE